LNDALDQLRAVANVTDRMTAPPFAWPAAQPIST
jgi:hypothetical protein